MKTVQSKTPNLLFTLNLKIMKNEKLKVKNSCKPNFSLFILNLKKDD